MTRLEVTVTYADRKVTLPNPEEDTEVGRKLTEILAFDILARPEVESVTVTRQDRIPGGQRGTYR
jgi:hypothetical protein